MTGTSCVSLPGLALSQTFIKHWHRSGVGRELVLHILARGDKAIATARGRSFSKLADLEARGAATYELDVNASQDDLHALAKKIIDDHGHVDVIVNNAGAQRYHGLIWY